MIIIYDTFSHIRPPIDTISIYTHSHYTFVCIEKNLHSLIFTHVIHICIRLIHNCELGHYVIVPKHSALQYSQRIGGFLERIANRSHRTHCHTFYLEMWIFCCTFRVRRAGYALSRETQFDFLRDCITP